MASETANASGPFPPAADDGRIVPVTEHRAPGGRAWSLVAALSLIAFAIIGGTLTSLGVYLPVLQREFGWSETAMGGLPVAMLLGMSAGNLVVGRLMARLGIRGTLAVGIIAAAIGWAAAARAGSLPSFMAAMALAGAGAGIATIVPGVAAITRRFDARRGLAIGAFIGACALASSVVPPLSGWLIAEQGWRSAILVTGGVLAVLCLPLTALVRMPRDAAPTDHGDAEGVAEDSAPAAGEVARLPAYWLLTTALTVSQLCMNGILFNIVAFFLRHGFAQHDAIAIYSVTNLMALPGLFIGGALADRYGARVMLPGALLLQAAGTLCLLGVGGADLAGSGVAIAGFILLWGLAGGLPSQIGPMVLADLIGSRAFASMLGVMFTITGLIGALAPVGTGWLYEVHGGYALPIIVCGLLAALAAFMTVRLQQRD